MNKILQYGLLSALVVGISACGGGSSSKKPVSTASSVATLSSAATTSSVATSSVATVATTTTYTVSVDVPVSIGAAQTLSLRLPQTLSEFFVATAHADEVTTLTAANFAVVIVDLAGNVLERIALTDSDISKNTDGSWSLVVPGDPRLDCVIVADVTKPIELAKDGNINQDGFVYAPTTAADVDIDVGSTAAYKNFIEELGGTGTFESLNINPTDTTQIKAVENLVNNIQVVVADQTLTGYTNVTEALAAIQSTVTDTVKQEVLNVKSPAQGTAVTLIRDEGGLFYFEGEDPSEIFYGGFVGTEGDVSYYFDGETFVKETEEESEPQLVLSSEGWVASSDKSEVASFNEDGTVTLQDTSADGIKEIIQVTQVFDLAGRNVSKYLAAGRTTALLGKMTNPETTFAAGAKGYRVKVTRPADTYWIHYQPNTDEGSCPWNFELNANDYGGNCNHVMLYSAGQGGASAPTDLSAIFSADVEPNAEGFVAVDVGVRAEGGMLVVQLLNDAAKTERFYVRPFTSAQLELVGQGTWKEFNLPGLTENARTIHIQIPEELISANGNSDGSGSAKEGDEEGEEDKSQSPDYYIVKQAGFLRPVYVEKAGLHSEDVAAVFNGTARDNVLTAFDYTVEPTLLPTATITVDGSAADWADVAAHLVDPAADQKGSTSTDLTQVSIAKSSDKIVVLMKLTGDFAFPYVTGKDSTHYEVGLHFYDNAFCVGESNGFMVVNNFTMANGENYHTLDSYFGVMADPRPTEVASSGNIMETSFYVDYLPQERGDYISLTATVHSSANNMWTDHDLNRQQTSCLKIR